MTKDGYDLIIANIVVDVIIRMAPDVGKYLSADGHLIVSGIISERAREVTDVLTENGFVVDSEQYENGWYCASVKKK